MLTSLWRNLTVGAHNWPHSSDTETTPVRAGSSASPPHKPKEPAEGVQTSCNMDVSLVHNPISPWVCGAPLSTLPSQPARGIWGHWCRDSLSFSLLPSRLHQECPPTASRALSSSSDVASPHLMFPTAHCTMHAPKQAGGQGGQLAATLGHSRHQGPQKASPAIPLLICT